MLADICLRTASNSDCPQIMALLERCHLTAVNIVSIIGSFFVALRGSRIIGCAAAEPHGESILIRSVGVDPLFRNQGIASRLVEVLLMQARGAETRNVFLFSKRAPAFFARWGFLLFPSDKVPTAVQATPEFQLAKASAALCMRCELR
ncbi:GNAT family N-acetyltransferase [Cupriavidus sp. CuC1]|uniref:GNAT family N-acetyltransferase n=1 Tax=Cupriavidus sp. CuC1 TaxID=3373131 RepID=UPI0037D60B93